jgi:hypothetical protein
VDRLLKADPRSRREKQHEHQHEHQRAERTANEPAERRSSARDRWTTRTPMANAPATLLVDLPDLRDQDSPSRTAGDAQQLRQQYPNTACILQRHDRAGFIALAAQGSGVKVVCRL